MTALPITERPYLSAQEAASLIGMTYRWVLQAIADGRLRASRVGLGEHTTRYRIARADLDAFMAGLVDQS